MTNATTTIAIQEGDQLWTYAELEEASRQTAYRFLQQHGNLKGKCIAFMVDPGFDYVCVQHAIWLAGGIAVPLCLSHPLPSLQYVLEDTSASIVIASSPYVELLSDYCFARGIHLLPTKQDAHHEPCALVENLPSDPAMILYTSGTTNKPKGVVLSHGNLTAQMDTLIDAWKWNASDHTLCVLPLHHVHGCVNVVGCALRAGARLEFLSAFSAEQVAERFKKGAINVFMAVPTIYYKLITYYEAASTEEQQLLSAAMKKFRLMVCGSAALPVSIMEKWEAISGQILLERYGMTEIGMGISNPYSGERRAGHVGQALPGVAVQLVDEAFNEVPIGEQGEILIKGNNVFNAYWNKPNETKQAFTKDGWFKTGDVAILQDGYFKIIGRNSIDIIKSGGYKISALEIEEVLRTHPCINDCAVVGIPDEEWGERVVAAVTGGEHVSSAILSDWMKTQLPNYKTPKQYLWIEELPRNAMGKVVKAEVKKLFNR